MKKRSTFGTLSLSFLAGALGVAGLRADSAPDAQALKALKAKVQQFAPVAVGVEAAKLPAHLKPTLKHLIAAAQGLDQLYFRQLAEENPAWRKEIAKDPKLVDTLAYFDLMYGPWDRVDEDRPFWGNRIRPKGATFYPKDLTAKELNDYVALHPEQKEALTSYFTVVRREGSKLKAVPYSQAYKAFLEPAAKELEAAAKTAKDPRLATYLRADAKAFRTNEYRPADMAWMDLGDGELEVVLGPYETYNDELMGYKAAFEAFVTLRDPAASTELAKIQAFLPEMEKLLPLPDEFKNARRGMESPISVVDVLYNGGDNRPGVQTLAFNLPNDEFVREKKGSKKVMLRNISEAKFQKILLPIAAEMVRPSQLGLVTHPAFFNHALVHEMSHGIGPGTLTLTRDGKTVTTSVNQELKNLYSCIEECKADTLGMHEGLFLVDKGLHPETFRAQMCATYLAGLFRSVRFGTNEAHGKGNAIQFNYLMAKGALVKDPDGKYGYVPEQMAGAIRDLAHDLLLIEAHGSYDEAKAFIEQYGVLPQDLVARLASLKGIPTDIRLSFPLEAASRAW